MPRIKLKPKSPEYADPEQEGGIRQCEMPGCSDDANHKAPKHRGLDDHYFFCLEHAKEYNKAWDFFDGMSDHEVQNHMHKSMYGDRPTWKYGVDGDEDFLRQKAQRTYYGDEEFFHQQNQENDNKRKFVGDRSTPEYEAMAIMGLEPPVELDEIKTRYKMLAKKYHPDLNRDNPNAEELLKKINMAYTILKLAFEEYKKLPEHYA